ncbi:MAG: hypothetical protein U0929_07870 [Planctomycetaceae bacterium]
MQRWIIAVLIAALFVGWYLLSRPTHDFRAISDKIVEQDWMVNLKKVDAIEFLNGGGHFADHDASQGADLDKNVVRPLVERLKSEGQLEVIALIDQIPDRAFSMAARLPEDRERLLLIKRIVREADEAFPGVIMRQYGYHWMYFTVLDEKTAKELHAEEIVEE